MTDAEYKFWFIFYGLLSLPAISCALQTIGLILISKSDLWVTSETIQLGITEHLYFCALLEACE